MKPFTSKHCTPLHHGSHRISVVKDGVSHKHDGAGSTIDKKPYEKKDQKKKSRIGQRR